MLRIFFLLSATLLLHHPSITFARTWPFPPARSVSLRRIESAYTGKPSRALFWKKTQKEDKVPSTSLFWTTPQQEVKFTSRLRDFGISLVEGTVKQGPRVIHHIFYWLTAFDALESVRFNEYRVVMMNFYMQNTPLFKPSEGRIVPSVYSRLFYFARLRPRLLYAVGALLRALQLCTPFYTILDPSAGVGAGVNFFATIAGSRWVQPVVLGWATTKWLWVWLGARKVEGTQVPIKISIRELERKDD